MSKLGTIHIDKALTDVSVAYRNAAFIAEMIFPRVDVIEISGKYYVYGKENFRVRDDRRAPGAQAQESRWSLSNDTYYCGGHALKDYIPMEDQNSADPPLDLMTDSTEFLTEQVQLAEEYNLSQRLAAGMTGTSLQDLTSAGWDDDDEDPFEAIMDQSITIGNRIGRPPNVFMAPRKVWAKIAANENIKARITGATSLDAAKVTKEQFASLIEVDEVVIGGALLDTANEGQTASLDSVWGRNALLFYRAPNPGRKVVSLGYTYAWGNAFGAAAGAQFVKRYYEESRSSWVVEVHKYYDQKLTTKDAGCWFTNCIASS